MTFVWFILSIILIASIGQWWVWRELKTYPDGGHLGHQLLHIFLMATVYCLAILTVYL